MWSGIHSPAANAAEIAGEKELQDIFFENAVHTASPSASGRIAMAVYHAVFNITADVNSANYFCEWWSNDGGDLEAVPDGTPPEH